MNRCKAVGQIDKSNTHSATTGKVMALASFVLGEKLVESVTVESKVAEQSPIEQPFVVSSLDCVDVV